MTGTPGNDTPLRKMHPTVTMRVIIHWEQVFYTPYGVTLAQGPRRSSTRLTPRTLFL